ncbi:MAG: acetate/propionate family kinase [Candidatus Colwellbacteria bacterium]|nr:acetate/propionate family kinase [Candidatus Colwellbacteria bacterium]
MDKQIIVVMNAGSTSLKYKAFFVPNLSIVDEGQFSIDTHGKEREVEEKSIFLKLIAKISERGDIVAFAHRVVHGGENFFGPVVVDKSVLSELKKTFDLAPLHNPHSVSFIGLAMSLLPKARNVAVFDTGFYKNLPDVAKIYPLPYEYFEEGIRKYGFHGISHEYVAMEAAKKLKKPLSKCSLITVHLGGGSSVTAIKNGKAIDTSMGFTPLEGLTMISRSGDIDAGIVFYLMRKYKLNIKSIEEILNRSSGLKGISGLNDFREIMDAADKEEHRSILAFDMFVYKIRKYIGSYAAILGKVDAIVFTGGIGSGRPKTRNAIMKGLTLLKGVKKMAITTNEELSMARKALGLLK